jgi:regulatory protein
VIKKKILSKEEALQKIRHYCAYQERCHAEVKEKLYSYSLYKVDVETILSQLIEDNYLNESRFATQFALGKFRIKQWGKAKIKHELNLKRIGNYNIVQALKAIDNSDYETTVIKLAKKKLATLKTGNVWERKQKTVQYLLQKGFENAVIYNALENLV